MLPIRQRGVRLVTVLQGPDGEFGISFTGVFDEGDCNNNGTSEGSFRLLVMAPE